MEKWTTEKRAAYPKKYFGWPEERKYPVEDQDDLDSAFRLVGRAPESEQARIRSRLRRIGKQLGLKLPKADASEFGLSATQLKERIVDCLVDKGIGDGDDDWDDPQIDELYPAENRAIYRLGDALYQVQYKEGPDGSVTIGTPEPTKLVVRHAEPTFTADGDATIEAELAARNFETGTDFAVYEGLIFKAGEYPDKQMKASTDQLASLCSSFSGAPIKLDHRDGVLDQALEGFGLVEMSMDGPDVRGIAIVPKWLKAALGERFSVSVGIMRDCSAVREISVVSNPRIANANLEALFENTGKHRSDDVERGSKPRPAMENSKKKVWQRLKQVFDKNPQAFAEFNISEQDLDVEDASPAKQFGADADPRLRAAHCRQAVTSFTEGLVRDAKLLPSQRQAAEVLFSTCLSADGGGIVQFSEDGSLVEGSAVKALREFFERQPAHSYFAVQIKDGDGSADVQPETPAQRMRRKLRLEEAGGSK